ncbi:MAG: noncanonical pyrimidine nucleotidase, YjjG family, partial [Eubacteriales bacterium]
MIRNLFFDLDDTLLDFHAAERNALTHALTQMDVVPTNALCIRYSAINAALWRKLERGEITRSRL